MLDSERPKINFCLTSRIRIRPGLLMKFRHLGKAMKIRVKNWDVQIFMTKLLGRFRVMMSSLPGLPTIFVRVVTSLMLS